MPDAESDRREVAAAFDMRAATYDDSDWHLAYAERLVEVCGIRPGAMVVDACTGTGKAALAASRVPSVVVVGVDISEAMLGRARATAETLKARVAFIRADVVGLSAIFRPHAADVILCSAGLLYLPVDRALADWATVLKPGGRLAFNAMAAGSPPAAALFRSLAAEVGIDVVDRGQALGTAEACRRHVEAAGLRVVRLVEETVPFSGADVAQGWEVHRRMSADALARLAPDVLAGLRDRYDTDLARLTASGEAFRADVRYVVAEAPPQGTSRDELTRPKPPEPSRGTRSGRASS